MNKSRDTIKYSSLTAGCLITVVVSIFAYLYFLNVSVVEVVLRSQHETEIKKLYSELAELESSYVMAQHRIASEIAQLDGYETEIEKIFITRHPTGLILGANQ